ncbi:MAG: WD40 repeat domain-containing protein [Anaerolineales bacterium]|nr:WD40 repeat domain-containing protein [Anaerolineales bacterium]
MEPGWATDRCCRSRSDDQYLGYSEWKKLFTLTGYAESLTYLAWSPDGQQIVIASEKLRWLSKFSIYIRYNQTTKVWDAQTGELAFSLTGHTQSITDIAWSPHRQQIVTVSKDGTAKVWDARIGALLFTLIGQHSGIANEADWSTDGRRIIITSGPTLPNPEYPRTNVWDALTGELLLTLSNEGRAVAWNSDVQQLVTTWGMIKIWNIQKGNGLTFSGHKDAVTHVTWGPDGTQIATSSSDNTVKIWDAQRGTLLFTLTGHTHKVTQVVWSPDRQRILTASDDEMAKVWDAQSSALLFTLTGHTNRINQAVWSSDGQRILTASNDGTAKIWNAQTGQVLFTLGNHQAGENHITLSPDGQRILITNWDETAKIRTSRIWDAQNGSLIFTLSDHNEIFNVSWSPDGQKIVTGIYDNIAKVWDVQTGTLLATLSTGTASFFTWATWSPDGQRILTQDVLDSAKIWDVQSGLLQFTIQDWGPMDHQVNWNPDGQRLVTLYTGYGDIISSIKIWDAHNGRPLFAVTDFRVNDIAWSSDGQRIVTAREDGTARIHFVGIEGPGGLLEFACSKTGRNMTQAEWAQYMGEDTPYHKTCPNRP